MLRRFRPFFFKIFQLLYVRARRIAFHADLRTRGDLKRGIDVRENLREFLRREQAWRAAAEVNAAQTPLSLRAIIAAENVDLAADCLDQSMFLCVVPMIFRIKIAIRTFSDAEGDMYVDT